MSRLTSIHSGHYPPKLSNLNSHLAILHTSVGDDGYCNANIECRDCKDCRSLGQILQATQTSNVGSGPQTTTNGCRQIAQTVKLKYILLMVRYQSPSGTLPPLTHFEFSHIHVPAHLTVSLHDITMTQEGLRQRSRLMTASPGTFLPLESTE